ncbi:hypothetical protein T12_645, partial [Trichinella patagoniensis]
LTLIKCSCIFGIVVGCLIFNKASRYYFVLLSRPATNGVNQRLNDQIRLDSRVNYYYSPLALRRYSFVANRERFLSKDVPSGPSSFSKPNCGFRPFSTLAKLAYSTPLDLLMEGSTSVNPASPARRTKMLAAKSLSLES